MIILLYFTRSLIIDRQGQIAFRRLLHVALASSFRYLSYVAQTKQYKHTWILVPLSFLVICILFSCLHSNMMLHIKAFYRTAFTFAEYLDRIIDILCYKRDWCCNKIAVVIFHLFVRHHHGCTDPPSSG